MLEAAIASLKVAPVGGETCPDVQAPGGDSFSRSGISLCVFGSGL